MCDDKKPESHPDAAADASDERTANSSKLEYDEEATKQHRGEEYAERLKEIDRRTSVKDAAVAAGANESTSIGLEAEAMELLYMTNDGTANRVIRENQRIPSAHGYKYCLLNKTNHRLNPAGRHAAVRCLGFFHTKDEARAHLHDCAEGQDIQLSTLADRLGDIHIAEVGKWVLVPKTKDRDRDASYTIAKIDAVVGVHLKERIQASKDFALSKTSGKPGKTGVSLDKQRERKQKQAREKMERKKRQLEAKKKNGNSTVAKVHHPEKQAAAASAAATASKESARKVPRSMEVRNQSHMVIATLKDFTNPVLRLKDAPEPVVMFFDAFDRLEDAQKYIEDSLKDYVTIVDLDVVDLYEWVFVESMDPDLLPPEAEKWRDEEQTAIMRHRKVEQRALEEEKRKQQNRSTDGGISSGQQQPIEQQQQHEIVADPATIGQGVEFYDAKPVEDMARQMRVAADAQQGLLQQNTSSDGGVSSAKSLLPPK